MHARLFGIPLEFVNLLIALFAYICAYSTVFWQTSKPFSFIFSLHLLVYSATIIWSYLGFSVLYRIQETNYASVRPVGLGMLTFFVFTLFRSSTYHYHVFVHCFYEKDTLWASRVHLRVRSFFCPLASF